MRTRALMNLGLAGIVAGGAAQAAGESAYTLDDVLGYAYPSELVAAADAARIAWVVNERGRHNIWTAAAPDFSPQKLTDYGEDDGQPLPTLALGPGGKWAVYVRGGAPNGQGQHPNPASLPSPPEQAVWAAPTDASAAPERLGEGHSPVVSPTGDAVAYVHDGQVHLARLPPASERQGDGATGQGDAQPLFEARGNNGMPRFSPDGTRIAFVSDRDDHAFIGVYDRSAETIQWIAPGVDRDTQPVWSPDGESIAFIRLPGRKRDETLNLGNL